MMGSLFVASIVTMGGIALVLGLSLAYASKKFYVRVDPRVEKILAVLPGANCAACSYPGCAGYAEAIVLAGAPVINCSPGGDSVAKLMADIMGVDSSGVEAQVAAVHCKGGDAEARSKYEYRGVADCRAAALIAGGDKECQWGCLGLGTCVDVCPFDAIHINANGLAEVDPRRCTGCQKCVVACPKGIIDLMPASAKIFLGCSNRALGAKVKKYCKVGCTACTLCVKITPPGGAEMKDNLPTLDYSQEENFVAAAYKCPQNCFIDLVQKRPKVSIDQKCNGCTECAKVCPVRGAIEGTENEQHKVVFEKCIGCGRCIAVCPAKAINLMGALGYSRPHRPERA